MTLAEQSAFNALRHLGYIDPKKHPKWSYIVNSVQDCIDNEIDAMAIVAGQDAIPSWVQILDYEIRSSWWASRSGTRLLQKIPGKYFAWKVRRKYKAYERSIKKGAAKSGGTS